jgi:ribose/xylose/arabinose/galactoside ABC-type transport system permease subunit
VRYEDTGLAVFLLLLVLFFEAVSDDFRRPQTLVDMLREVSPNAIAAVGVALLMLGGEFDLSIGSMLALVGVVTIGLFNVTGSVLVGVLGGLACGLVVGSINGYLVTRERMSSLMVTLAMMFVIRGVVYVSTGKAAVLDEQSLTVFQQLYQGSIGPLPIPVLLAALVFGVFQFVLTQTPFGRALYASGGNPSAARLSGIRVARLKLISFVVCSLLAAVAGLLITAQTDTGYFDAGATGFELIVIAAVVLGGVSLAGGQGSLVGAMLGVLIIGVTNKGLRLLNVYTTWQLMVVGVVMILAVYLYAVRRRLSDEE